MVVGLGTLVVLQFPLNLGCNGKIIKGGILHIELFIRIINADLKKKTENEHTEVLLQTRQISQEKSSSVDIKCKHLPWDFPQMAQSTRTYLEQKCDY